MLGAWVNSRHSAQVMFIPRIPTGPIARYVVRAEPGRRDALIAEIERKLSESNLNRAITWVRPHDYYIERSYRRRQRMVAFLSVIVGADVAVTALGIVGLASFHVNVRTKQIGTRRAVGARRIDIIRYFMVENWLLTTGGVIVGAILAFAFGQWLSAAYALPRLEPALRRWRRRAAVDARPARGIRSCAPRRGDPARDCDSHGVSSSLLPCLPF